MGKTDPQIKLLKSQVADFEDRWKRALADYQNLGKRIDSEKEGFINFANGQLILKILPALDSLERAEKHLKNEGLTLAIKQLKEVLASEGLERIQTKGLDFNPQLMECVDVKEGEEGKVLDEISPGYKLNNRVLKVAQVRVGKAKINERAVNKAKKELKKGNYL